MQRPLPGVLDLTGVEHALALALRHHGELAVQNVGELVGDGSVLVTTETRREHELDHHQTVVVEKRPLTDGGARDRRRRGDRESQDEEKDDAEVWQG